jgi:hypothetical protein
MTKELGPPFWLEDEMDELTDKELLEMVLEDPMDLIDEARWEIKRTKE